MVAGLARDTTRIGLGVLVSPVTFRTPGNLAKVVVTADELSGGRIELGLGAGWHEDEHRRHGFPFPEIGERAEMLEETLEIVHGLWDEPDGWSFTGKHYAVEDALFRPKPGDAPRAGRPPPEPPRGRTGDGALVPDRGPLRGRVQPVLDQPATAPRSSSRSSTTRAAPPGASRPPSSTR